MNLKKILTGIGLIGLNGGVPKGDPGLLFSLLVSRGKYNSNDFSKSRRIQLILFISETFSSIFASVLFSIPVASIST